MCAFWGESGAGQIKRGLQAANHQPCGRRGPGADAQTQHEFEEQVKLGKGNQKFGGFLSQPGLEYDDHSLIHCTASSLQLPS